MHLFQQQKKQVHLISSSLKQVHSIIPSAGESGSAKPSPSRTPIRWPNRPFMTPCTGQGSPTKVIPGLSLLDSGPSPSFPGWLTATARRTFAPWPPSSPSMSGRASATPTAARMWFTAFAKSYGGARPPDWRTWSGIAASHSSIQRPGLDSKQMHLNRVHLIRVLLLRHPVHSQEKNQVHLQHLNRVHLQRKHI